MPTLPYGICAAADHYHEPDACFTRRSGAERARRILRANFVELVA